MTDKPEEQPVTEEQSNDMELMALVANRLVEVDLQYSRLVSSMLASRQLYAMCLYELERLCEETDFKRATKAEGKDNLAVGKTLTEAQALMLKEILINAAAMQAQQPFEENQLFEGMVKTVFPWMRDVVAKHNEAQAKAQKEAFNEAEKARVALPVGINLPILADKPEELLDRRTPILLVGESKFVNYLIEFRLSEVTDGETNVRQAIRLASTETPKEDTAKICFLKKSLWEDCTSSNDAFQRVYSNHILPKLNNSADVLIVDDLRNARLGLDFSSLTTVANEAQKRLKRWAEKAGCLLVGCLPLNRQLKAKELNLPEYETLRVHNILRGVAGEKVTIEGVEHYRIFVGQHEACCVPASEVDSCSISDSIVS